MFHRLTKGSNMYTDHDHCETRWQDILSQKVAFLLIHIRNDRGHERPGFPHSADQRKAFEVLERELEIMSSEFASTALDVVLGVLTVTAGVRHHHKEKWCNLRDRAIDRFERERGSSAHLNHLRGSL